MYYRKNKYEFHRFAISVNRKIGNAVERNYIKRKMKEFFRLNSHLVEKNHDLWIVTKGKFTRQNAGEIEELFMQSLQKVNNPNGFAKK